jgi:hypothetical protein
MKKSIIHRWARKVHRYFGIFIGVQFLAWTIGGLYFSWTKIDEIRGDNLKAPITYLTIEKNNAALDILIDSLRTTMPNIAIKNIQLVDILGKSYYQIQVDKPKKQVLLFDMKHLQRKTPLNEQEAVSVALKGLNAPSKVIKTEYLNTTNGHHEYREKPLPAFAVTFDKPSSTTVYVSTELGTIQSFRNNNWRVFDFLWMLHTMDYQERDNINNWILRIFSILGLITLLSGFLLYVLTSKFYKK